MSGKGSRRAMRAAGDSTPVVPESGQLITQSITTFRTGLLPDPSELEHYERIHPGLADRLMAEAEKNGACRRALNEKALDGNLAAQKRGTVCATVLGGMLIAGGTVAICLGHSGEGLASIGTAAGSIVGAFIYGRKKQADEREAKRREAAPPSPQG